MDGTRFYFDHATATSFAPNQESTPINGGQGLAPLAYINGQQTLDITFTSAEFTMDMFSAANGVDGVDGAVNIEEVKKYTVTGNKITIPYKVDADSVYIRGMEAADAVGEGKYTVTPGDESTEIAFNTGEVPDGTDVQVFFEREVENVHTLNMTTSAPSSRGSVTARWPLYAGSNDGAESAVKGYVQIEIPLCRVTALPGFDTSYKTAATNAVTFSAMDAGRADELWYLLRYIPLA
ncbi:MAG: hypothetical protein Q4E13_12280 [Clostridia bacterium]|nr:hypothetical protein [Clostridia bacterium]